ncbi:MAG: acetyl-CoA C-acyltransferase [Anaerolineales bacterium]
MSNKQTEAVILSATRTPIGRFLGGLSSVPATQLGALVVRDAVSRAGLEDLAAIDEVLMGCVVPAGLGQNPARQAAIYGGLPGSVGAATINKVCGSGLKTVMLAAQAVKAGDGNLFVAGGMESMSGAPFLVHGRLGQLRYGHSQLVDALQYDGLWDPFEEWIMGEASDFIADEYEVSREAMDKFAYESHQKAIAAIDSGKFKQEIVPVEVPGRKGQITVVDTDESPRRDTNLEALAKLRPVFRKDGKSTAGNAPGLSDGVGYAQQAVDPKYIFIAPARAIPVLLDKVGWTMEDVDLVELNEAFAAQVLADGYDMEKIGWDWEKVNVNGGGIALGHPIGASGARVLTTLIYALKDRGLKRGIASLCLGGGEAVAMAVEIED